MKKNGRELTSRDVQGMAEHTRQLLGNFERLFYPPTIALQVNTVQTRVQEKQQTNISPNTKVMKVSLPNC